MYFFSLDAAIPVASASRDVLHLHYIPPRGTSRRAAVDHYSSAASHRRAPRSWSDGIVQPETQEPLDGTSSTSSRALRSSRSPGVRRTARINIAVAPQPPRRSDREHDGEDAGIRLPDTAAPDFPRRRNGGWMLTAVGT